MCFYKIIISIIFVTVGFSSKFVNAAASSYNAFTNNLIFRLKASNASLDKIYANGMKNYNSHTKLSEDKIRNELLQIARSNYWHLIRVDALQKERYLNRYHAYEMKINSANKNQLLAFEADALRKLHSMITSHDSVGTRINLRTSDLANSAERSEFTPETVGLVMLCLPFSLLGDALSVLVFILSFGTIDDFDLSPVL